MERLLLDFRQAGRQLAARPGFALAAVVILAVGIGANAATFSIVNGLLLRPLPYPDSEAIVSVGQAPLGSPGPAILETNELRRLWEEARSFEELAAFSPSAFVWDGPDGPVTLFGTAVTPSLFPLLRAMPRLGRLFTEAEAVEGAHQFVLLSHGAWTRRFASDPDVIGAPIVLNDEPHTVLGVLPDGFESSFYGTEVWTPLVVPPYEPETIVDGSLVIMSAFTGVGRLRDGVSPAQAETEVRTILERGSERPLPTSLDFETRVMSLREERGRPFRPALLMLAAATGLVLLMACANVAGLLLARGVVRQRELAVRGALGAGRGRIVRQLLTESVVLGVAGGAAGLAVAVGIVRAAPVLMPRNVPGLAEVGVDGAMLAFTAAVSVVSGLLFGTAPALAWSRVDLARTLNEAGASAGGFGRLRANRGQAALAVTQVVLALVLLTGAGLLLRSFVSLVTLDLGFEPANVVVARIMDPASTRLFTRGGRIESDEVEAMNAAARSATETLLARLERIAILPGVDAVALSSSMPLNRTGSVRPFTVAGRPAPADPRERLEARILEVSPDYADVVRLHLQAGRFFTDRDRTGSPRVAVVSESFARAAFGGEPAVGQRLVSALPFPGFWGRRDRPGGEGSGNEPWEVIGVVADVTSPFRGESFGPADAGDVYLSMLQPDQDGMPSFGSLPVVAVRTAGDPLAVIPFLQEALADVSPGAQVNAMALETILSATAAQPRFYALCASIFGGVALLLAAFGLYGGNGKLKRDPRGNVKRDP
ncbi:MAG: FtsX-like permease family protein, partial [Acidobacteria bacterium]|nr:FtsX-like permease family protein [Acidobacteriota bacterium]